MKYRIDCSECGTRHTVYVKALNTGLIQALGKLIEYYNRTGLPANLQEDLPMLSKNQYAGFQQLRYFQLVAHNGKNSREPTTKGQMFWQGTMPCENRVATFRNRIIPYDHECRDTDQKKRKQLYIREFDGEYRYKQREQYQAEKGSVREPAEKPLFEFAS